MNDILLGINPFVGVDHYSSERGRARMEGLDADRVYKVVQTAFNSGATGLTYTLDTRISRLFEQMKDEPISGPIGLFPLIPNTPRYASLIAERGILGAAEATIGGFSSLDKAKLVVSGGMALMTSDPFRGLRTYLDLEVRNLQNSTPPNAKIKSVLIHELGTDLMLSLRAKELIQTFITHIVDSFGILPGFATRNFPRLIDFFSESGISTKNIVIMTPFNKLGFQMAPSKESCERALKKAQNVDVIAMNVLASGQIALDDAVTYLKAVGMKSVAVGVSTEEHAQATFAAMKSLNSAPA